MPLNKDLIIKLVVSSVLILFALRVIIPLLIDKMKGKQLGLTKNENDIDYLIKRQKENLKSVNKEVTKKLPEKNSHLEDIRKELNWGGTEIKNNLKVILQKNYFYQFSDSKISSFFLLIEKRNYLTLLENEKINKENILNIFATLFTFLVLIDENKQKEFHFTEKCSKKIGISPNELTLAIQLKILLTNKNFNLKDDFVYSGEAILAKISDESLNKAISEIIHQELFLWAKSPSHFFEELSLYVQYATLISPLKKLEHNNDIKNALLNLNLEENADIDSIKKSYKKLAQIFHPDKLAGMKLTPHLEKIVKNKFQTIQQSFEIASKQVAK